jgi:Family of unknown function (DUF6174)
MRAQWLHGLSTVGTLLTLIACGGVDETLYAPASEQPHGETPADAGLEMAWEANRSAEQLEQRRAVETALSTARAEWERLAIRDYTVKVRRVCFCAPTPQDDVRIRVSGGVLVEANALSVDGKYDVPLAEDARRSWYTVTGLFDLVSESLAADRVVVEYDESVGYPAFVLLDYQLISSEEGEIFEMWDFVGGAP